MQSKDILALLTDDDAVSPVIGVILMVAITVILAAVIGAFVIGVGGETQESPQAAMDFEYNGTTATITHDGGDPLPQTDVVIKESDTTNTLAKNTAVTEYTAGDEVASGTYDSGETIKVIWDGADAGETAVIAEGKAP